MTIQAGDVFPQGRLLRLGPDGPQTVTTEDFANGRVALFGLPGAFTSTCTSAHMPSFVRTADKFRERGVQRIICITVNDPFVCDAWVRQTGADAAGIEVLADADGSLTAALGLQFDAPAIGLFGRCRRFAALLSEGRVEVIDVEEARGACSVSAGEALLEKV